MGLLAIRLPTTFELRCELARKAPVAAPALSLSRGAPLTRRLRIPPQLGLSMCADKGGKEGNMMPWHDVEIQVEGPAAWDLLCGAPTALCEQQKTK